MYFEDVTIGFTDFVGFTLATEKLAAEEIVGLLHEYFTAFDRIVSRYGLEKMKTIGDSYMFVSGMPDRRPSHPVDAVLAALEMVETVRTMARPDEGIEWQMRVGLHTGPVIAGVVGIHKFAFDVWGDSVNFSSRMESSGAPNRVNLSERTYSRVKDFVRCTPRGRVVTKDGREVGYVLRRRRPRQADRHRSGRDTSGLRTAIPDLFPTGGAGIPGVSSAALGGRK